jgi:hypothetical protein
VRIVYVTEAFSAEPNGVSLEARHAARHRRAPGAPAAPPAAGQPPALTAAAVALPAEVPVTPRAFNCRCGRPVFFRNSICLACQTPLGYDPELRRLIPLQPAPAPQVGLWQACGTTGDNGGDARRYQRCANLNNAAACNWLVAVAPDTPAGGPAPLCRCCSLTRTLPDLTLDNGALWWNRIELAKRQLVSSLIALGLPVSSKFREDPEHGLVFDLLRAPPGGPPVITGHTDGVITLDVEEADDRWREQRRAALAEPYRTLLGHLRHETGHYYWQRLVENSRWLTPWRTVFGDERGNYTAALKAHYDNGPPADWARNFVSAYASSHPWEDWAETWAHYLHLADTLDTARSFGLDGEHVELNYERYTVAALEGAGDPDPQSFLRLINNWMELTGVLNELSRSMGMPDFYPFVLSLPAVRKLHLVHRIVSGSGEEGACRCGR